MKDSLRKATAEARVGSEWQKGIVFYVLDKNGSAARCTKSLMTALSASEKGWTVISRWKNGEQMA